MVPIYHHHKADMKIVLAIIIKTRTLLVHNRTKPIASKYSERTRSTVWTTIFYINTKIWLFFSSFCNLIGCVFWFSHSSSNNENWNGFDSNFESSTQSYQGGSTEPKIASPIVNNTTRKQQKSEKSEKPDKTDFGSLDVKASKPKPTNKTKSIEDDAWNLLNN